MSDSPAIEVKQLVREFRKGPLAVDHIDLTVSPGESYGFLGPNGAGKSTTVLMLTTLLPPTSGTARVGGYDVVKQGAQVRASIGAALRRPRSTRSSPAVSTCVSRRRCRASRSRIANAGRTRCSSVSASPTPPTGGSAATRAG